MKTLVYRLSGLHTVEIVQIVLDTRLSTVHKPSTLRSEELLVWLLRVASTPINLP